MQTGIGLTHAESHAIRSSERLMLFPSKAGLILWLLLNHSWIYVRLTAANGDDAESLAHIETYIRQHPEADPCRLLETRSLRETLELHTQDLLYMLGYRDEYLPD